MKHPTDLEKEARETRDLAKRARRLAQESSLEADRARLNRFADELAQRAAEMEAEATALRPITPSAPVVTRQQQQVQQQGAPEPAAPDPSEPKTKA